MSSPTITFSGYHLSRGYEVPLAPSVHVVPVDSPADLEMMALLFTGVFYVFNGYYDRLIYDCPGGSVHYHDEDVGWVIDVVSRSDPDTGQRLSSQDDLYLKGKHVGPLVISGYGSSRCVYNMPRDRFPVRDAIMDAPEISLTNHFGSRVKRYVSVDAFLTPHEDAIEPMTSEILEWFINLCDRIIGVGKVQHEVVYSNGRSGSLTLRCLDNGGVYRRISSIPGETRYVVNFLYNVMTMMPQEHLIVSTLCCRVSGETFSTLQEVLTADLPHKTFVFLGCR